MKIHIERQGPRRLVLALGDPYTRDECAAVLNAVGEFLASHEHPQGGRFMQMPADPPPGYREAIAIVDNQTDAHEPPLFARLHRAVHGAIKRSGASVESTEPDDVPDNPPGKSKP